MRTVLVLSLSALPLLAQSYSLERHRLLPVETWSAAAAADFDLDGDVDLVVRTGAIQFLVNDGSSRFTPGAFLHSAQPIPPAGGERSLTFAVPTLPALLGAPLFAQALFVHQPAPATWRFGNVLDLTVRL
jgi:hypothetical protein